MGNIYTHEKCVTVYAMIQGVVYFSVHKEKARSMTLLRACFQFIRSRDNFPRGCTRPPTTATRVHRFPEAERAQHSPARGYPITVSEGGGPASLGRGLSYQNALENEGPIFLPPPLRG